MRIKRKQSKRLKPKKIKKSRKKEDKIWIARKRKHSAYPYILTVASAAENHYLILSDIRGRVKAWTNTGRHGFTKKDRRRAIAIKEVTYKFMKHIRKFKISSMFMRFKHFKFTHKQLLNTIFRVRLISPKKKWHKNRKRFRWLLRKYSSAHKKRLRKKSRLRAFLALPQGKRSQNRLHTLRKIKKQIKVQGKSRLHTSRKIKKQMKVQGKRSQNRLHTSRKIKKQMKVQRKSRLHKSRKLVLPLTSQKTQNKKQNQRKTKRKRSLRIYRSVYWMAWEGKWKSRLQRASRRLKKGQRKNHRRLRKFRLFAHIAFIALKQAYVRQWWLTSAQRRSARIILWFYRRFRADLRSSTLHYMATRFKRSSEEWNKARLKETPAFFEALIPKWKKKKKQKQMQARKLRKRMIARRYWRPKPEIVQKLKAELQRKRKARKKKNWRRWHWSKKNYNKRKSKGKDWKLSNKARPVKNSGNQNKIKLKWLRRSKPVPPIKPGVRVYGVFINLILNFNGCYKQKIRRTGRKKRRYRRRMNFFYNSKREDRDKKKKLERKEKKKKRKTKRSWKYKKKVKKWTSKRKAKLDYRKSHKNELKRHDLLQLGLSFNCWEILHPGDIMENLTYEKNKNIRKRLLLQTIWPI